MFISSKSDHLKPKAKQYQRWGITTMENTQETAEHVSVVMLYFKLLVHFKALRLGGEALRIMNCM